MSGNEIWESGTYVQINKNLCKINTYKLPAPLSNPLDIYNVIITTCIFVVLNPQTGTISIVYDKTKG